MHLYEIYTKLFTFISLNLEPVLCMVEVETSLPRLPYKHSERVKFHIEILQQECYLAGSVKYIRLVQLQ